MTADQKIGLAMIAVGVGILALRTIDQARRNHRARKARAAVVGAASWLDTLIEEALEDGVQGDPVTDWAVCHEMELAEGWV